VPLIVTFPSRFSVPQQCADWFIHAFVAKVTSLHPLSSGRLGPLTPYTNDAHLPACPLLLNHLLDVHNLHLLDFL
jgi:hypothetical protein